MDIAIIGMSGRFPDANTLDLFSENLKCGKDLVRPLSFERVSHTGLPYDNYQILGYLENIDLFDHVFFGLSLAEAEAMDPHQRLLLEVVYETFESSGYNLKHFEGSDTGVFIGDVDLQYYKHAKHFEPDLITGNLNAAVAGRIARFFNLRGGAQMIDSSCSSSLTALYFACNELKLGNLDAAIVAAANLILFPQTDSETIYGIESTDGKSRAFSDNASGTGSGEAACAILIKPLNKAIEDGDNVHAVIKSIAINQDGALSANLASPDAVAQSQVILKAMQKADIQASTITNFEAHGTGTKLGDPIEIEGISRAFAVHTDKKGFCAISSLKSNIGHTNSAAGLASLLKAILSLKNKVLYPSLHCEILNPLIDFKNSPVYVNTSFREWALPKDIALRRSSVSSFGFMGTNTHVVLEEAMTYHQKAGQPSGPYLIALSAKTTKSLFGNLTTLQHYLQRGTQQDLDDIAFTFLTGRQHYQVRFACVVNNLAELLQEIQSARINIDQNQSKKCEKLVLIFSGYQKINQDELNAICHFSQEFDYRYRSCISLQSFSQSQNANVNTLTFYYSFYGLLEENRIKADLLLGNGVGKIIIELIHGKISLSESIERAENLVGTDDENISSRLSRAIDKLTNLQSTIFLECGKKGLLSDALYSINKDLSIITLEENSKEGIVNIFRDLYLKGLTIQWKDTYFSKSGKKIALPHYQFNRKRCWLSDITSFDSSRWYYRVQWKPLVIEGEAKNDENETWLFIHDCDETYFTNKRLSIMPNAINIRLGDFFQVLNNREIIVDITDQSSLARMFEFLRKKGVAFNKLAYFFSKDNKAHVELAIKNYFHVTKAFCREIGSDKFYLMTFTFNSLGVCDDISFNNSYQSAIHGFNIGMISEYPAARIRCIDLDDSSAQIIERIFLKEWHVEDAIVSLGYRLGKRYCRSLETLEIRPEKRTVVKENGVYLVTGGSSGIGMEVVKWLTAHKPLKIMIIGRKELPDKCHWYDVAKENEHYQLIQKMLRCEDGGSQIFYWSADLGNEVQVSKTIDEIENKFGKINGVIHSAGITGSFRLERHEWQTFRETLTAKMFGTIHLAKRINPEHLSFFILFSSLNSLIGVERGINYSAANAFLDNFSSALKAKGYPAHVINWTSWKETGMWKRAYLGEDDLESLLTHEGLAVVKDIISGRYQDIIVSKTNPRSIESKSYVIGAINETNSPNPNLKIVDVANDLGEIGIEQLIKDIWLNTLKVESVEPTDDFFNAGGHSLTALKMILQIEKTFSIRLEIADILEASTFEKMCILVNTMLEKEKMDAVERANDK